MILYDICLFPAQFFYIIVCIRKVESRVQIADRCAPCGYSPYVTSFPTRGCICCLQLLLALISAVILGSDSRILLSQTRNSSNLEGQVPVLISPRNRVAQLYPQVLGSLFVVSYDSQGCGGGIRTCLYASALTAKKPPLPTIPLLLHVYM
jgi:hypothetical protein